jgi:putative endonuclease
MQYYVYILFSKSLNKYYIGSTSNIEDRLKKHNHIHRGYTAAGQPWILVYSEFFDNKAHALLREKQLKNWKNRGRILSLINAAIICLPSGRVQGIPTNKSGGS